MLKPDQRSILSSLHTAQRRCLVADTNDFCAFALKTFVMALPKAIASEVIKAKWMEIGDWVHGAEPYPVLRITFDDGIEILDDDVFAIAHCARCLIGIERLIFQMGGTPLLVWYEPEKERWTGMNGTDFEKAIGEAGND